MVIAGATAIMTEKAAGPDLQDVGPLVAAITVSGKVPPAVGVPLMVVLTLKEVWRTMVVLVLAGLRESPAGSPEVDHDVL